MDQRQIQLQNWLEQELKTQAITLTPIIGDASFRRYFRMQHQNQSYIAMDAPPDREPCHPFINIAKQFLKLDLQVPLIFAENLEQGFLLISDLGEQLYVEQLTTANADKLYRNAIDKILIIQKCEPIPEYPLDSFLNGELQTELKNFSHWFVQEFLQLTLSSEQRQILASTYELLLQNAKEQPQCCIHRDYHSRNLMVLPENEVGILDFQDAMTGPITYDLVSLLRDCYIDWPQEQVANWTFYYFQKASSSQLLNIQEQAKFIYWFDLMGIQRHLKASFIFARKFLRDNNKNYLQYIPRTLNYVNQVSSKYNELTEFYTLLTHTIWPLLQQKLALI